MAPPETANPLITQLLALLRGGQAHATFDQAIKDFPAEHYATVPHNLPYSAWQLLEHLRITQRDILNFSAPPTGGYQHMAWPDDYWPKSPAPPTKDSWHNTIAEIRADQHKFEQLLGRRPEPPARSPSDRRPQRLPPRRTHRPPPLARHLALSLTLRP
jgi:hypothetical protein